MELLPSFFVQPFAKDVPVAWKLNVHETHRDQVLELPPGSKLLATSSQTPLEIWMHGKNVLAVQGAALIPGCHGQLNALWQCFLNIYCHRMKC